MDAGRLLHCRIDDTGITWRHVAIPCAIRVIGFVTFAFCERWLFCCFLDGMMTSATWRRDSGGIAWTRFAAGDHEDHHLVRGDGHVFGGGRQRHRRCSSTARPRAQSAQLWP